MIALAADLRYFLPDLLYRPRSPTSSLPSTNGGSGLTLGLSALARSSGSKKEVLKMGESLCYRADNEGPRVFGFHLVRAF